MAIEMNRKILTRISALLCAILMGISGLPYTTTTANAAEMNDFEEEYSPDDGRKLFNLEINGHLIEDCYNTKKGYETINPGTYNREELSVICSDNEYGKYHEKVFSNPCMHYARCRIHELTGIWLNKNNFRSWGFNDSINSGGECPKRSTPSKYSVGAMLDYNANLKYELGGHCYIIEDIDYKNKKELHSQSFKSLNITNHTSSKNKTKYGDSAEMKLPDGEWLYYIYFGNAVAQKRIKDHIKECGDHIIYTTIKEPTCNAPGAKIATCSKCGWVCDPAIEIKHTGHRYIKSYVGKKEPIDIADHKAKYVCEDCGHTLHYNSFTINEMKRISRRSHYKDKKADEIRMGRNITSIGADAFNGCTNVRTIEITSTKLKSVGKNAFKNTGKNAFFKGRYFHKLTDYVPAKQYKKYKNMFIKAGLDKRSDFVKQYYDEGEDMDPDSHTDKTEVINDGTEDDGVVVQVKQ